jgi:hypothetical protein
MASRTSISPRSGVALRPVEEESAALSRLYPAGERNVGQIFSVHSSRAEFGVRQMRKLFVAIRDFLGFTESVDEVQDKSRETPARIGAAGGDLQGDCGHGPPLMKRDQL